MKIEKNGEYEDVKFSPEYYQEVLDFFTEKMKIDQKEVGPLSWVRWRSNIKSLFLAGFTIKQIKWGILKARQKKVSPQWSFYRNVAYILFETREQYSIKENWKENKMESISDLINKYKF